MVTAQQITTADQLLEAPGLGRCELLRGELVMMPPAGFEHGRIEMAISAPLACFVKEHSLGVVTGAETGFLIGRDPDTVRAPDVAFVRAKRVPATPTTGFFEGAPDLAVEVLSPNDRASELLATQEGSSYIVRRSLHDPKAIRMAKKAIRVAFENQVLGLGFAMVELLSTCPTNWHMTPANAAHWLEEKMMPTFPLGDYKVHPALNDLKV